MLDVLHHLPSPMTFFNEAKRVLETGWLDCDDRARYHAALLVLFSTTCIKRMSICRLIRRPISRRMWRRILCLESRSADVALLAARHRDRFLSRVPELTVRERRWLSLWAYPLSGGFKAWSLIPASLVLSILAVEKCVLPMLGLLMGFRLAVVLERS